MSILKIVVYSILFIILSPGFLINLYPVNKGYFLSEETSYTSIIIHTFILAILLVIFEYQRSLEPKNIQTELTNIEARDIIPIITIILFVLLQPGLILTLSPDHSNIFFSNKTSYLAVLLHSIIFIILFGVFALQIKNIKNII